MIGTQEVNDPIEVNPGKQWDFIISPAANGVGIDFRDLWRFRDLLILFVRRDFVAQYKQTILGPLWYLVQPLLMSLTFDLIFGRIAMISTGNAPAILFYLAGITVWQYFADCLNKTSATFVENQSLFGKVYFPRIIVPLSIVVSNLFKFSFQFALFFAMFVYYWAIGEISPNITVLLLPFYVFVMGVLGLCAGMIVSSLTTKYRDLAFLMAFGLQLLFYATPVIYPMSAIPEKYQSFIRLNPLAPVIESFKYSFLGIGKFQGLGLIYSFVFGVVLLICALVIFNRVERTYMDTV